MAILKFTSIDFSDLSVEKILEPLFKSDDNHERVKIVSNNTNKNLTSINKMSRKQKRILRRILKKQSDYSKLSEAEQNGYAEANMTFAIIAAKYISKFKK